MTRRAETRTGGRQATTRNLPGKLALSVGFPKELPAPAGWRWVKLTDVARLESGHTPSRSHSEYWDGDIPWIGLRDAKVHHGATIDLTAQTVTELGIRNSSARTLPKGTVCLSRTASVGYVVTMGRPMATSQDFVNWICSDLLDRRYLVYLLLAEHDTLLEFASGATHQTIYYPEVKAFHILLPPLPEQRRIVAILDEAFAGIATAVANAEKNRANARELFESHLDAVFKQEGNRGDFVELSELATDITDGDHMPPPKSASGIPFVTISNIDKKSRQVDFSSAFRVPRSYFDNLKPNRKPRRGDVLYTVTGSFGIPVLVRNDEEFCFQRHIGLIRPKSSIYSKWLYYLMMSPLVLRQAVERATGTAQKTVSLAVLRSMRVPLVSESKQHEVADKLEAIEAEAERLAALYERKLAALVELKQSFLRKAFAGELTDKAVAEAAA